MAFTAPALAATRLNRHEYRAERPDLPRNVRGLAIEMDIDLHLVDVRKGSLSDTLKPEVWLSTAELT